MNNITVSVIIPVYNSEEYLRQCLEGIIRQTMRDIEVICVDDGSTDSSLEIIREYSDKDNRFRLICQKHNGSGFARNAAIDVAQGEYVAFMDSDDYYPEENTLCKLYKAAKTNNYNICGGSFSVYNSDGSLSENFSNPWDYGYSFGHDGEMLYCDYQFDYGFHRFIYKRSFLNSNNIRFPLYLRFQDPPFFVRAMVTSKKFYAIHDVTYRYREHSHPLNIAVNRKKSIDLVNGLVDNLEMARSNGLRQLYKLTINRCCYDWWSVVNSVERVGDEESIRTIERLRSAIDLSLYDTSSNLVYQLHYLRNMETMEQLEQKISQQEQTIVSMNQAIEDILKSKSFRIGRIITYIPRILRNGISDLQRKK